MSSGTAVPHQSLALLPPSSSPPNTLSSHTVFLEGSSNMHVLTVTHSWGWNTCSSNALTPSHRKGERGSQGAQSHDARTAPGTSSAGPADVRRPG